MSSVKNSKKQKHNNTNTNNNKNNNGVTIDDKDNPFIYSSTEEIPISEILNNQLYLGSESNARDLNSLSLLGITHILNVANECENYFPNTFHYINLTLQDYASQDILSILSQTCKTIHEILNNKNNRLFIHCVQGISRSVTIVIAYLLYGFPDYTLTTALKHVKSRRSIIEPNPGFLYQLKQFYLQLHPELKTQGTQPQNMGNSDNVINHDNPLDPQSINHNNYNIGAIQLEWKKNSSSMGDDDESPLLTEMKNDGSHIVTSGDSPAVLIGSVINHDPDIPDYVDAPRELQRRRSLSQLPLDQHLQNT